MAARTPLGVKLDRYKSDFQAVTGAAFKHFYCPILHVDEDVALTKGHIVPDALSGQQRVLQRSDVDNGFGSFFESESIDAISQGIQRTDLVERLLANSADAGNLQRFRRRLELRGDKREIPFRSTRVGGDNGLIVSKSDFPSDENPLDVRLVVELDARSSILVSCLRMSYLYWFKQLGYRYVFSNEGILVAWVLRSVYEKFIEPRQRPNRKKPGLMSDSVKAQVNEYCLQFANFLRPVPNETVKRWPSALRKGTIDSNWFLALVDEGQPYGRITILKLGNEHCAVLTPMITDERGWALMDSAAHLHLEFTMARWNADKSQYELAPPSGNSLIWPSAKDPTPPLSIHEAAQAVLAFGRLRWI
ncbi:MAG: hypothetical protein OXG08_06140 [Gammaproteobacteria bacterium]|nr:hypothetical protein [Gammaproteobacteria bacterium]